MGNNQNPTGLTYFIRDSELYAEGVDLQFPIKIDALIDSYKARIAELEERLDAAENALSQPEKLTVRQAMPILDKLQKRYRGLSFLKLEYIPPQYASVFNTDILFDAIRFLRFVMVEVGVKDET